MNTQPNSLNTPRCRGRIRVWFLLGAVAALAGMAIYLKASRVPAGPDAGTELVQVDAAGPQQILGNVFRVGTFNIHGGRDAQGNENLSRTAQTLRSLDVIGLNEVHGDGWGSGPADNQAGDLGRLLKKPWLFAATEKRWGSDDFGNGFLTKLPVKYWQRIMLPGTEQSGYRNTLLATVVINGQTVRVMITHIDRSYDRQEQLQAVGGMFATLQMPAILMGDMNSDNTDETMRQVLDLPDVTDAIGQGMGKDDPAGRIDWILTRGLKVRQAGLLDDGASDHPMAWAELELISLAPPETQP